MADITAAELKAQFNEFNSVDDDVITRAISQAYQLTNVSLDATMHCAAHLLSVVSEQTGKADGGSGVVKIEKLGPQQFEYETNAKNTREAFFASSAYGRLCLAFERVAPARVISARVF